MRDRCARESTSKDRQCPGASIRRRVEPGRSAEDNRTIELFAKEQFWAQLPDDIIFEQDGLLHLLQLSRHFGFAKDSVTQLYPTP